MGTGKGSCGNHGAYNGGAPSSSAAQTCHDPIERPAHWYYMP